LTDGTGEGARTDARRVPGTENGWWFEDAVPGAVLRHPHGRTLDDTEHVWLAWVTHNISDVHGDAHAASRGPFGETLVLGALSVAIVIGLAEPAVADPDIVGSTLLAGWRAIRLSGPVRAGDTLRAESHIEVVRPGPISRLGLVSRTIRGLDQAGRVVVLVEETDRAIACRPRTT
jgi:acyl dehydratase